MRATPPPIIGKGIVRFYVFNHGLPPSRLKPVLDRRMMVAKRVEMRLFTGA
jgi:hypothetical protein